MPHDSKPRGALRPVMRGFHAVFDQKDPQCVYLAQQMSDQLTGLVLPILVALNQVTQPGIPSTPLSTGGWGMGHVTQALEFSQGAGAAGGDVRVVSLGHARARRMSWARQVWRVDTQV